MNRTIAGCTLSVLVFFSPLAITEVKAQCLLCGVAGYMIGSSGAGQSTGAGGGNTLYVAPRISERLGDPLAVHIAASDMWTFSSKLWGNEGAHGATLRDLFANSVEEYEKFTILEVKRVISPGNIKKAVFWFAYIEKDQLKPLSELPEQPEQ